MRIKHQLWRVSNGWLLVPEDTEDGKVSSADAPKIIVFRNLKEFADFKPKRERKSRATKPTTTKEYLSQPTE
jgi:hypothetical protein